MAAKLTDSINSIWAQNLKAQAEMMTQHQQMLTNLTTPFFQTTTNTAPVAVFDSLTMDNVTIIPSEAGEDTDSNGVWPVTMRWGAGWGTQRNEQRITAKPKDISVEELRELAEVPSGKLATVKYEELAETVHALFGYQRLKRDVEQKKLGAVLADLDIAVIPTAEVEAYMAHKLKTAKPPMGMLAYWARETLNETNCVVPAKALEDAVRIKNALPTAEFHVHELKARVFDPFLSVSHGGKTYYIAVWDEPDFDAKS